MIPWSYQGTTDKGFVVEERVRTGALQNRTGEEGEKWVRVAACPVPAGGAGEWMISLPMLSAGTREFRIYPDGEGERLVATLPVTLTWEMVLSPVLNIAKVAAVLIGGFLLLRIWANRRRS